MTKKGYFSKSDYTKGFQCPKILWMDAHMRDKFDQSLIDLDRLKAGNEIGDMAMAYFGDFVEVKMNFKFDSMAERTAELIAEAAKVAEGGGKPFSICEATFKHGDMVCMADIVRVRDAKTVDLIEVKSTTKVKEYHVRDLAYQMAVIEKCGFEVATASIMHIDPEYRLEGDFDLQGFFAAEEMTDVARALSLAVDQVVPSLMAYRSAEAEPDMEIGPQCNQPHACGYQPWCWRHVPATGVLSLSGLGRTKALKPLSEGCTSFEDALSRMKLTAVQKAQAVAETGGGDTVDAEKVACFLARLSYPLYYLDFETIQPIVPIYQGSRPWQQIPTQFSLHWVDEPGGKPRHAEFLAEHDDPDPRRSVAEALCAAIPRGACTTAYNMGFEKGRIKELAGLCPDLAGHLMDIHDGIVDLMTPFRSGWVYLKEMEGSYSIKKVLPALCPDDPELDYHALDGVQNGTEAMRAFERMALLDPAERQEVRRQLLRYCELDTLAMVRVHERLAEIAMRGLRESHEKLSA